MRRSSDREIFKIMSPDNRARVFKTNPGPRHPRVAIGIDKIDLPAKKDVTVIRAARDQNQRADENDFRRERQPPPHAPFKSAIGNSQFEIRLRTFSAQQLEQPRMLSGLVTGRNALIFGRSRGPVAQRLEQGTHNLASYPLTQIVPSTSANSRDSVRPFQTVIMSTPCQRSRRAEGK